MKQAKKLVTGGTKTSEVFSWEDSKTKKISGFDAAIAQALGMVRGSYQGDRTATRGELAAMLCRLLERQGANAGA